MALGVDPLLVQHDEFLRDLADGGTDLALGLGEVAATEAVQRRCLATDVLPERVDLVRRHVQLVAALVRHEQVVAFDATDRAFDHAFVLADAVLVVHDVVAGLEVLERGRALALAGAGLAVGTPATRQVGLGDDGELGVGHGAPAVQRGHRDVAAGSTQIGAVAGDRELEVLVEQDLAQPLGRPGAVGSHRDRESVGEEAAESVGQSGAVAADRAPPGRLHERGVGRLGRGVDRPEAGVAAGEQVVGRSVQPRELLVGVACPGRRQGFRQVVLLGEQVGRPVAHAAWFDQDRLGLGREHIGQQHVLVDEPRHPRLHAVEVRALRQPLPLFPAPRLRADQGRGPVAHVVGRHQFSGGEDQRLVEVGDRPLVVDAERGEAVDLVAPQVDADRCVGRRRVHVDDRSTPRELAPVLDELFAAVPELHELSAELVGVDDRVLAHRDRLDLGGAGPELLQECPHAGHDDLRAAGAVAEPPQHLQPCAHGLDRRAHAFERERLPGREVGDLVVADVLAQVVVQLSGHGAGGAGDDERPVVGQVREGGDRDRPRHLDDREARLWVGQRSRQARFVT